jgi:hypothetical protein
MRLRPATIQSWKVSIATPQGYGSDRSRFFRGGR